MKAREQWGIMANKTNSKRTEAIDVDKYIANCPEEVRGKLKEIRSAIRAAAPGATERTDYFQMPGYSYEGYDYDGMFGCLFGSALKSRIYGYICAPPVIRDHKKQLAGCATTKAIVSFPADQEISMALVKKLVKASVQVMKDKSK
jgi:uncharacterized protein YdhG (YjbR/CyaY superfamily)